MRIERLKRLKSHKDYGYTYDIELISYLGLNLKSLSAKFCFETIQPTLHPANPKDLENVLVTIRFGNFFIKGRQDSFEKPK